MRVIKQYGYPSLLLLKKQWANNPMASSYKPFADRKSFGNGYSMGKLRRNLMVFCIASTTHNPTVKYTRENTRCCSKCGML